MMVIMYIEYMFERKKMKSFQISKAFIAVQKDDDTR